LLYFSGNNYNSTTNGPLNFNNNNSSNNNNYFNILKFSKFEQQEQQQQQWLQQHMARQILAASIHANREKEIFDLLHLHRENDSDNQLKHETNPTKTYVTRLTIISVVKFSDK